MITLDLKREDDAWVSPSEGYIEVARLHRNADRKPILMEVRAEHLKDYLCTRAMGLYVASYYQREIITEAISSIDWENGNKGDATENDRWEGRIIEIHEGGYPYGEDVAIFHVARTDVDESDDIPDISGIPTNENTISNSWNRSFKGKGCIGCQASYGEANGFLLQK